MEVGLLRRVMKRNKQWMRVGEDVVSLPEQPKPARVLTVSEKRAFLNLAGSKPEWEIAYHASVVALNTTMRACEIRGLRVGDVNLFEKTLTVKRQTTKTDAGARVIPLTNAAVISLSRMFERIRLFCKELNAEYFVFPGCEHGNVDATRQMKGWRSAWRALTRAAGLKGLRFHDLRHQAVTELAELGLSDQTIMSIAGHVSKEC
jgi:integrase